MRELWLNLGALLGTGVLAGLAAAMRWRGPRLAPAPLPSGDAPPARVHSGIEARLASHPRRLIDVAKEGELLTLRGVVKLRRAIEAPASGERCVGSRTEIRFEEGAQLPSVELQTGQREEGRRQKGQRKKDQRERVATPEVAHRRILVHHQVADFDLVTRGETLLVVGEGAMLGPFDESERPTSWHQGTNERLDRVLDAHGVKTRAPGSIDARELVLLDGQPVEVSGLYQLGDTLRDGGGYRANATRVRELTAAPGSRLVVRPVLADEFDV